MKKIMKFIRKQIPFLMFLAVFSTFIFIFVKHGDLHKLIVSGVLSILFMMELTQGKK